MATRKTGKGRGAPGKRKSQAHKDALSASLKAFHAKKGKKSKAKRSSTRRKTSTRSTSYKRNRSTKASRSNASYRKTEMRKIKRNRPRGVLRIKTEGGGYVTAPR